MQRVKWIGLSDESIQRKQPNHPEVASVLLLLGGKIPLGHGFESGIHS
jgi:hypothetical protein